MATISTQVAQLVSRVQRPVGRQKLAEGLGWEPFDEEDDLQKGILLDFHYDNLMFCVQKGFPWQHVCVLVDVAASILTESTDKSLGEAIQVYQEKCHSACHKIGEENMKIFTEYFFETFMRHFKLYQCVFTTSQQELIVKNDLNVETPPELLPFTDSKVNTIWEYEQKVKQVEDTEENRKAERILEQETKEKEASEKLQENISALQSTENSFDRENLIQLINDIATARITSASHSIKGNITATIEDLDFMLQKTTIPRPQDLGPPPRYKTRTPLAAAKRSKSPKAANRDKSGKARSQSGAKSAAKNK